MLLCTCMHVCMCVSACAIACMYEHVQIVHPVPSTSPLMLVGVQLPKHLKTKHPVITISHLASEFHQRQQQLLYLAIQDNTEMQDNKY